MRLLLLCHGATKAVRTAAFPEDEPLDRRGAAAVRQLAPALPRKLRTLTSPALRTRQTAEVLGRAAAVDPGLRDIDSGRWRGHSLADVEAAEPDAVASWLTDPHAKPHGGESVAELIARVGLWLRDRPPESPTILAISHAAVLRATIVNVLGAPATAFWRIDAGPLTIVELRGHGQAWNLHAFADPKSLRKAGAGTA